MHLYVDNILEWSKLKQSADDNFEGDVNSRKFSKLVENTVGKGEIARYEQFLLFAQCFQKACFPEASKGVIVWEWVKEIVYHRMLSVNHWPFANVVDQNQIMHTDLWPILSDEKIFFFKI